MRNSFLLLSLVLAAIVVAYTSTSVMDVWQSRKQTPRLAAD